MQSCGAGALLGCGRGCWISQGAPGCWVGLPCRSQGFLQTPGWNTSSATACWPVFAGVSMDLEQVERKTQPPETLQAAAATAAAAPPGMCVGQGQQLRRLAAAWGPGEMRR